jgi:hypothetical protein
MAKTKKKGGTKGKGSAFERFIAKELSKWLANDPNVEPLIWRSSNSGGTFTTNRLRGNSKQSKMASDLVSIDERSKWFMDIFSIECKTGYKSANIFSTFKDSKSDVLKSFWEQASRDAALSERIPMLIFRPLGNSELIGLPYDLVKIKLYKLIPKQFVIINFNNSLSILFLCKLSDFLKSYTAEEVKLVF